MKICPKCGYERTTKDIGPITDCPKCGVIYEKYRPPINPFDGFNGGKVRVTHNELRMVKSMVNPRRFKIFRSAVLYMAFGFISSLLLGFYFFMYFNFSGFKGLYAGFYNTKAEILFFSAIECISIISFIYGINIMVKNKIPFGFLISRYYINLRGLTKLNHSTYLMNSTDKWLCEKDQ